MISIYNPNSRLALNSKNNNRIKLTESLKYLLYVCEDVLDTELKQLITASIKKIESEKITSGVLFYTINKLTKSIEDENIENIIHSFELLCDYVRTDRGKFIFFGHESINNPLMKGFYQITDDVYAFKCSLVDSKDIKIIEQKMLDLLNVVKNVDNETYQEIFHIVDEFYFLNTQKNKNGTLYSGSDFDKLGSVFFNTSIFYDKDDLFILDKIIHESAHQILLSVMIEDEIVLNPDSERYPSPLRTGLRTMNGIYHAAFVLYRIALFFNNLKNKAIDEYCIEDIEKNISENINKFNECYEVIKKSGNLTPLGKGIIENCHESLGGMYEIK